MLHYEDNLLARGANSVLAPLAGVLVTVTSDATGQPAALYSDNGVTPLAQPLTTDNDGHFGFYVGDGKYTLTFTSPRITTFTRSIALDDPNDNPVATLGQLAAPTGANNIGYTRSSDSAVMTVAAALDAATSSTAAAVRSTILTGLDLTTNAAITAADTVLAAFGKLQKQLTDWIAKKDASGGYAGLTGFAVNLWNSAGTFKSSLTNTNTAARTYTLPDKDLTVAATADINAANGASMVLLGQATVSSAVANIDFLTLFSSSYDRYVIDLAGVNPTSGATDQLTLRLANGGTVDTGSTYSTPTADGGAISSVTAQMVLTSAAVSSSTNQAVTMTIEVRNANDASSRGKSIGLRGYFNTVAVLREARYIGGAVSGFRLYWSSATTFATGTVRVYGIKTS